MKITAEYTGNAFHPREEIDLQRGEYVIEVKQERNPKFHRLAFALMQAMFENQEQFDSFEAFRTELKILTDSYDHYIRKNGEVVYMPHSWDWSSLDDIEFHEIFNKLLAIAEKRFGSAFVNQFATTA